MFVRTRAAGMKPAGGCHPAHGGGLSLGRPFCCRGFVTVVYLLVALAIAGASLTIQWRQYVVQAEKDGQKPVPAVVHEERSAGPQAEPAR